MDLLKNIDYNIIGVILFFGLFIWQVALYLKIEVNKWIKILFSTIGIILTLWLCYLIFTG